MIAKNLYFVTHTQRFTDHAAPQSDFVVDDTVSGVDYLCSAPDDRQVVSKDKNHTQSDAASILLGDITKEKFEEDARPKTAEDNSKPTSVKEWGDFRRRMETIRGLLQDPEFRRVVDGVSGGGKIDGLTRDQDMPVANRVRQIIVPSNEGDVMVSPLHPLGLSLFAGDIYMRQMDVLRFEDKKKKKGAKPLDGENRNDLPFSVRFSLANRYLSNMQNTGISLAGKKMARIKNFSPQAVSSKEWLEMAYPMRLSFNHPAVRNLLKAVAYRHAYVLRRGGSFGNGDAVVGKQTNQQIMTLFTARCRHLTNAMLSQLRRRRERFHEMDDAITIRSWTGPLSRFMGGASPDAVDARALKAIFVNEALQSLLSAAQRQKMTLFDMDKQIIHRFVTHLIQQKEV